MKLRRRRFLQVAGAAVAASAFPQIASAAQEPQEVPWSTGTEAPGTKAPPNATDCHHHFYDSRFQTAPNAAHLPDATAADYRLLQKRIGIVRHVVVQPVPYGVVNDGLIEMLGEFGPEARGVAVVNTSVSDAELKRLDAAGVRGIRLNIANGGPVTIDMLEPLARRIAPMGWHVELNLSADLALSVKDILYRLPCQIVFDHLAHMPEPLGTGHPAFGMVADLLQKGKAWVTLSGPYLDSKVGPPTYSDSTAVAQAYVRAAPERLVWGSDWPHPSLPPNNKPDDALLFDLLAKWAPDEAVRNRILVDNPEKLYGFS